MGTRGNWECVHDNSCVHYMCAWCECDMTQHALRLLRISAEKKTCVCVNTKRKKLIRMTCLLERTALLLFPLLFLLVVTVRCLCVIVVFVWVISHSDLRSGQRALMHMGKNNPPPNKRLFSLILLCIIPSSTLMSLCLTMKKRDLGYFYFPTSTSRKCPSIVPSSDFLGPLCISLKLVYSFSLLLCRMNQQCMGTAEKLTFLHV